jgi:hypothetical protein
MHAIPVVIGKNRLRGSSTGAMVDDDFGDDNSVRLRNILREEAKDVGVDPTQDWVTKSVSQLLKIYEQGYSAYLERKEDTIGFIYELVLPSGKTMFMGERRVLARMKRN